MNRSILIAIYTLGTLAGSLASGDVLLNGDRVFLQGKACAPLLKQSEAIASWKKNSGTDISTPPSTCNCAQGKCAVDVSDAMPRPALELIRSNVTAWGPNCFQAALSVSGVVPGQPRFTSNEELQYWLESPLCSKLAQLSHPEPGDIGVLGCNVSQKLKNPNHAFIFISDDLIFEKGSRDAQDKYALSSTDAMWKRAEGYPQCSETGGAGNREASYYRCMPLDSYLKSAQTAASEKFKKALKKVNSVETNYHCLPWSKPDETWLDASVAKQISSLADTVAAIEKLSTQEAGKRKHLPHELLLWEGLAARSSAMHYVLTVNLKNAPTE